MVAQACKFVLQLGSTMVLARLLVPEDFGLVAMVAAFTGFAAMFKDVGLSMATIQREHITHEQVSTLFWINVGLGTLVTLVVAASAPAIAWFYNEPRLIWITLVLAGTFVFSGFTIQHQALLRRQMRFKALATVEITAHVCSIVVAITIAWYTQSYWALVVMAVVLAVVTALCTWAFCGWLPSLPRRGTGVKPMLAFGGNLTGFSFVNYFVRNLDNFLIGWVWGPITLGFYSKAYTLLLLPINQINAPVSSTALSALSRLQSDPDRFRAYYRKAIYLIVSIGMPIVAFCGVAARDVILLVLGPQWESSVLIFQALIPAAFVGTFNVAFGWIFVPLGQADRQMRIGTLIAVLVAIAFIFGVQWGPIGVAVAFSVTTVVIQLPAFLYACAQSPISLRDVAWALWIPAAAAGMSGLLLMCLQFSWSASHLAARLLVSGSVFAALYTLTFFAFSRLARRPLEVFLLWSNLRSSS